MNNLSPQAIAILYGSSLYDLGESKQKSTSALPIIPIKIVIVTADDLTINANASQLILLNNILQACKIPPQEVKMIPLHPDKSNYKQITKDYSPSYIFLFGILPAAIELPVFFPHFQLQKFDQIFYLSSPSLLEIDIDKQQKIKLWNTLKIAFSI